MADHNDLIDALGGPHRLADALTATGVRVKHVTARAWRLRGSIPAKYWPHVQAVARQAGSPVSLRRLASGIAVDPAHDGTGPAFSRGDVA
jgi:hypothetical protein